MSEHTQPQQSPKEFVQDERFKYSSTRAGGLFLLFVGVIMAGFGLDHASTVLTTGVTLLGFGQLKSFGSHWSEKRARKPAQDGTLTPEQWERLLALSHPDTAPEPTPSLQQAVARHRERTGNIAAVHLPIDEEADQRVSQLLHAERTPNAPRKFESTRDETLAYTPSMENQPASTPDPSGRGLSPLGQRASILTGQAIPEDEHTDPKDNN